jgi:hypothetical protein
MAKKQKQTQASFIRTLLARGCAVQTILERARKEFPKENPTTGYINWLAKKSKGQKKAAPKSKKEKARRPARRTDGTVDEYLS